VDFDARLGKPPGIEALGAIDAESGHAAASESEGSRLPRARETQDERPARKLHGL
jgi:hypothetical protein